MGKLLPQWGQSPQPGKTYYYQKLLHHIFGIINSSTTTKHAYIVDETISGEKDSNLVCSFLFHYVQNFVPEACNYCRIYLDSATYFKTKFLVWWASEMISKGRFKRVILSYMVPGHTKFGPDLMFAQIANTFYKTDVFNKKELLSLIKSCDINCVDMPASNVYRWKGRLTEKYCELKSITQWNYMLIEGFYVDTKGVPLLRVVYLKVKRSVTESTFLKHGKNGVDYIPLLRNGFIFKSAIPERLESATNDKSMNKPLKGEKLQNIQEMYEELYSKGAMDRSTTSR